MCYETENRLLSAEQINEIAKSISKDLEKEIDRQFKNIRTMKELDEHIICGCYDVEHSIFFRTIEGDDDVYMSVHLAPLPFFKRLVKGIKYIFGYRSKYGDFDEIIITRKDVGKVEKVVRWLNQNHNPIK